MQQTMWCDGRAALLGAIALCFLHVPRLGAMELLGQAGVLGEWELTGNLTEGGSGPSKGIFRSAEDEARRDLHSGRTRGTSGRDKSATCQPPGIADSQADVGRRSLHLQRAQDARLRGHDVVRGPRTCSVDGVAQIVLTIPRKKTGCSDRMREPNVGSQALCVISLPRTNSMASDRSGHEPAGKTGCIGRE